MHLKEVVGEVNDILEKTRKEFINDIRELEEGEIAEVFISGWVTRNREEEYRIDIWWGEGKAKGFDEYLELVDKNREFLEMYASSLSPTRVKILLLAYKGINEGELSEKVGLKGGALHYHLRSLIALGLIKREDRGFYVTTKYGSYVIRTAIGAVRKFRRSVEEG